jgi:hypothetical protein
MTKTLDEIMKDAAEEHGLGGGTDFFHFSKSGDYKLRVLTQPVPMGTHFFGKGVKGSVCYGGPKGCPFHGIIPTSETGEYYKNPTVKFNAYVLDRTDGKVKLGELPWSVVSVLSDLEKHEDWTFDGYPMPYDITVKYDKENKDPKQIYKTIASPKREPITTEVENELIEKTTKQTVEAYVESRKTKQMQEHKDKGIWLSEDVRAERQREFLEKAQVEPTGEVPTIEYPEETINPEDIPF